MTNNTKFVTPISHLRENGRHSVLVLVLMFLFCCLQTTLTPSEYIPALKSSASIIFNDCRDPVLLRRFYFVKRIWSKMVGGGLMRLLGRKVCI